MTDTATFTPEEIEKMRFIVSQADQLKAKQVSYERLDYCTALTPIVIKENYQSFLLELKEIQASNKDDGFFGHHVDTLITILETLQIQVNQFNRDTRFSLEQQRLLDAYEEQSVASFPLPPPPPNHL